MYLFVVSYFSQRGDDLTYHALVIRIAEELDTVWFYGAYYLSEHDRDELLKMKSEGVLKLASRNGCTTPMETLKRKNPGVIDLSKDDLASDNKDTASR